MLKRYIEHLVKNAKCVDQLKEEFDEFFMNYLLNIGFDSKIKSAVYTKKESICIRLTMEDIQDMISEAIVKYSINDYPLSEDMMVGLIMDYCESQNTTLIQYKYCLLNTIRYWDGVKVTESTNDNTDDCCFWISIKIDIDGFKKEA